MSRPQFTIRLTIQDNHGGDHWTMAIGCDEAMSISWRSVEELKIGVIGSFDAAVELMRTKQLRRDILMRVASQLAARMADRLEDSEGWHDASRIGPARRLLQEA